MNATKKLTDAERTYVQGFRVPEATKALLLLDEATARVAELERQLHEADAEYAAQVNAATARADEAERDSAQANMDKSQALGELNMALHASQHWSAEAAALRAESDGRHTANLALCAELERLQAINAHMSADIAAKDFDHRAGVERVRALLSEAAALLSSADDPYDMDAWRWERDALLRAVKP